MCWGHKICRSNKEKIYAIVTRYSTRRRTQLRLFANCQSTGQRSNYVLERRGGVTIAAERATEKTLSTSRQGNGTDSTVETRIWGLLKFRWILSEKRGAGSQLQRTRHCLLDRATELLRLRKETCFRPKNWFRSSGRRRFVLVYLVFQKVYLVFGMCICFLEGVFGIWNVYLVFGRCILNVQQS